MTFEELLELNADDLEKLTDEQLQEYLAPCLKDCPPIDLKVIQDEQDKIKLEKQLKKDADKELSKSTSDIKQTGTSDSNSTTGVVKSKAEKIRPMMDMLKVMQEQLAEKIRLQKENKT
jgi:hypothetical protein